MNALARATGHARTDDAVDDKTAGDIFQFLGHVLAQCLRCTATLPAGFARGKNLLMTLQAIGQRLAPGSVVRLLFGRRMAFKRFNGAFRGPTDFFVFERQQKPIQGLGTDPKPMPAHARQLVFELFDKDRLGLHFRSQNADQLLELARIVGKISCRLQHRHSITDDTG